MVYNDPWLSAEGDAPLSEPVTLEVFTDYV
jgi:hypothetical protein